MTKKQDAITSRVVRRQGVKRNHRAEDPAGIAEVERVLGDTAPPVGSETGRQPQHPEDRARDEQLRQELTGNAGDSALQRHRANLTGTENEEDGIPDDEEGLDDAAEQELADQRVREHLLDD